MEKNFSSRPRNPKFKRNNKCMQLHKKVPFLYGKNKCHKQNKIDNTGEHCWQPVSTDTRLVSYFTKSSISKIRKGRSVEKQEQEVNRQLREPKTQGTWAALTMASLQLPEQPLLWLIFSRNSIGGIFSYVFA